MVKYCSKCGAENEDEGEFCTECGNDIRDKSKKHNSISINKKTLLIGIVAVIIIAVIGILALTGGNVSDIQYIASNPISVDSVTLVSQGVLNNNTGQVNAYKVAFTANENIDRCSMECYAYAENGSAISPVAMWFTPYNIVVKDSNLTKGSTYTGEVEFCNPETTSEFKVAKFEFFVYKVDNKELKLIDKFTYNVE